MSIVKLFNAAALSAVVALGSTQAMAWPGQANPPPFGGEPELTEPGNTATSDADARATSLSSARSDASADATGVGVGIGTGGDARASGGSARASGGDAQAKQAQGQLQAQDASSDVDTNITFEGSTAYAEGDEATAASAFAGTASICVPTLAAQARDWGVSLGGVSTDCRAQEEAKFYLAMHDAAHKMGEHEQAEKFEQLAFAAAESAAPNTFMEAVHHVKEFAMGIAIPVGLLLILL